MLFLPREDLPPKLIINISKISENEYAITTTPKLDPAIQAMFMITLKQCAKGFIVKSAYPKILLIGQTPNFKDIVECVNKNSPIPVELDTDTV